MKKTKERYYTLDLIRGITLISMLLYHFYFDLYSFDLFGDIEHPLAIIWQNSICITFVVLSGFCFSLGRKPWRRGLIVLGCGLVITLFTCIFMKEMQIIFGILSFMGIAMLITLPLNLLFKKIKFNHWVGLFAFLLLFIITKSVWKQTIFFGLIKMPEFLYQNIITACLGFPPNSFYSADYFPIFPWIFLYLAGYFLYQIVNKHNQLGHLAKIRFKPVEFIGRHTLWIYIVHQPIIYGITYLIYLLANSGK